MFLNKKSTNVDLFVFNNGELYYQVQQRREIKRFI